MTKDEARELDTSSTPDFLGLTGPAGVWAQTGAKGENVIIGIVDGGAWPEHPSFSDRTGVNGNATQDGKLGYQQIPGWNGRCVPGEAFNASNCNQKLIGARYYNAGWGGNAGIDAQLPWEYNSPRDFGGHGTHTASTAGGNRTSPSPARPSVFGSISGIAPRARIAAYKVCWETGAGGSCFNSDSVAAIDQAVADGVDVINFSISGSQTSFRDPVEVAFLFAADAGVFVAASAGNSGPSQLDRRAPEPVADHGRCRHAQPQRRRGCVTLGNGATFTGASVATATGLRSVHRRRRRPACRCRPDAGRRCATARPTAARARPGQGRRQDRAVRSRRDRARRTRASPSQEAGGIGMVLVNTGRQFDQRRRPLVPDGARRCSTARARRSWPMRRRRVRRRAIAGPTIVYT